MPSARSKPVNCWGIMSPENQYKGLITKETINSEKLRDFFEELSLSINDDIPRVVILDNASVHKSKMIREKVGLWQERGLYFFFLPPYSPHMNKIEILWKHMKGRWIRPQDYDSEDTLWERIEHITGNLGGEFSIDFSTVVDEAKRLE